MPQDEEKMSTKKESDVLEDGPNGNSNFVLAYRIDSRTGHSSLVRATPDQIQKDTSLIRWGTSFDGSRILEQGKEDTLIGKPVYSRGKKKRLKPLERVAKAIGQKRFGDVVRSALKKTDFELKTLTWVNPADPFVDYTKTLSLEIVTMELRKKGLWKDDAEEICFTQAFPLSQLKTAMAPHDPDDIDPRDQPVMEHVEVHPEDAVGEFSAMHVVPRMAQSSLHNVMRPQPKSLEHSIARDLADVGYFEPNFIERDLYAATILFSRHVEDPAHFIDVLIGGLFRRHQYYWFRNYENDVPRLKKLIQQMKREFFVGNRFIAKAVARWASDPEKSDVRNVWDRFDRVWVSLTQKQRNALERLYMLESPLTYEEAASSFQISVDSLQDRVRGAIKKFKNEFPEFAALRSNTPSNINAASDLVLNGVWRNSRARKAEPLFTYDRITGERREIPNKTSPKKKKLSDYQINRIKAAAYEAAPVPMFPETDYFCGLKPGSTLLEKDGAADQEDNGI